MAVINPQARTFSGRDWRFTTLVSVTLLVSILVYLNSIQHAFLLNSINLIQGNESITSLANIRNIFLNVEGPYAPLSLTSFTFDYFLWGMHAEGYHITNILLHAMASLMVGLFSLFFVDKRSALYAALVFALLPVHSDAVDGLVGRGEILATIFSLFAFMGFLHHMRREGVPSHPHCPAPSLAGHAWFADKAPYSVSLVVFVLALLSSRTAIILPFLLALYALYFLDRRALVHSLVHTLPYFAIFLGYIALTMLVGIPEQDYFSALPPEWKILSAINVAGNYLQLVFLPLGLNAFYDFPAVTSLTSREAIVAIVSIVLFIIAAVLSFRFSRRISFALLFVPLGLLPLLHMLPQRTLMSESYLYLPTVGFCLLMGIGYQYLSRRYGKRMVIIALVPLCLYAYMTVDRNQVWAEDILLLSDALEKSPNNAVLHYNMGVVYDDMGIFDKALLEYNKAIELNPKLAAAYYNMGCIHARHGNIEAAMYSLKWAVARGIKNVELLSTDPDLAVLRNEPVFEELLVSIEQGTGH